MAKLLSKVQPSVEALLRAGVKLGRRVPAGVGVWLEWAPPKNASTGPPLNFLSVGIAFTSQTLRRFSIRGGASLKLCRFFEIGYLPADT